MSLGGMFMRVSKWGNSLAVRLPRTVVDDLDLKVGDLVEIVPVEPKRITIAKDETRLRAVERMRSQALSIPASYVFNRDEANSR